MRVYVRCQLVVRVVTREREECARAVRMTVRKLAQACAQSYTRRSSTGALQGESEGRERMRTQSLIFQHTFVCVFLSTPPVLFFQMSRPFV